MNRLFTKIAGVGLSFAMAIGVGVAIARNREDVPVHATVGSDVTIGDGTYESAYETGFENCSTGTNYQSTQTYNTTVGEGASWSVYYGTVSTNTVISGTKSMHMRWYSSANTNYPHAETTSSIANVRAFKFNYQVSNANVDFKVQYGTNGSSWTDIETINTSSTSKTEYSHEFGSAISTFYFRVLVCLGTAPSSGNYTFRIDDIVFGKAKSASLSTIEVATAPTKITYYAGEYFNPTGLVIQRNFSDSTHDTYTYADHTSDFTFSPSTSTALKQSDTSVTITYGGKSTTQAITVNEARTLSSISISGYTTTFEQGDEFTFGGTVTAHYSNSTTENVTGNASFTGYDMSSYGNQTVTVSYTESGVTKTATYSITVNKLSTITFVAGTDVGTASSVSKSGITISSASGESDYSRNDNYRVYAGKDVTITSTVGNIAKIEFTCSSDGYNTLSGDGYTKNGASGLWAGDSASVTLTADGSQTRINELTVTLASTDPMVELDVTSASSVTMMKGDSDTTVKIRVSNIETKLWAFTFDEGGDTGLETSSYINVSAGAAVENVHTLTITTKAIGSTVLHISVSGTACDSTVQVTVNAKPASMTIDHSDIHAGEIEIQSGHNFKQVSFSGLDTDDSPYAIAAGDVEGSIISGDSHVSLSGARIYGETAGTAVVRYTLKALTSVYAEVTVNVVDDYKTTVNAITFNANLTATQGESVAIDEVFASKVANTHFGSTEAISDNELLFSYTNDRNDAIAHEMFSYDFAHGSTADATHKNQTVYVFVTFDEDYAGTSFAITVEQANDPLTAITLTNAEIENDEVNIARGGSLQLTWSLTPANPTDGRDLQFSIDDCDDGVDISVNSTGLITVDAESGLGSATVLVEAKHDTSINAVLMVNVTLESMTYVVNEAETLTPSATVSLGDTVVMVATDKNSVDYELTSFSGASTDYGVATSYTTISKSLVLNVVEGNSDGTVAFKTSDNKYVSWVSGKNSITNKSTLDDYGSWIIDGTTFQNKQDETRFMYLNYNSGTPRFACYADKSGDSTGNYTIPTFVKITGGDTPYNVTETLFNAITNNFGAGKTYAWSESCETFNSSAWATAGNALTNIANYSSYKLNRAVANANGNEVEKFLAKYDFVIGKFGTAYDFLGRFADGGINHARIINPVNNNVASDTGIIVVVITLISSLSVAGYFFIRRRKEDR